MRVREEEKVASRLCDGLRLQKRKVKNLLSYINGKAN